MNGISHKQAIQLIDRRMDGMLNESQRSLLEEHLHSCDSCQAYAAEMDGLSVHVQNEFHRRWDSQPGPTRNVFDRVTMQASRLPVRNRIATGARLFAGAMTLIALVLAINFVVSQVKTITPVTSSTETVSHPVIPDKPDNPLLAFASDQNGNLDIYTMHADGSGLTNLTNNPTRDFNPFWAPDGKRIAFERDQDGFTQIYLMNAHGSNVIQLTHDQADHFLPSNMHGESNPWSPDGKKLLFLGQAPETEGSTLYSLDINSGSTVRLANGQVQFNNLSWSPDGKYVGYVLNDSPTPDATFETGLYVIDSAGSNLIRINQLIAETDSINSPAYHWSRDGSSIIFIAYRHLDKGKDQWIAYEAVLESKQLIERATSSTIMDDWWEGTSLIHGTDLYTLTWLRADGTFNTFKPLEVCDLTVEASYGFYAKRSPNGGQVINTSCPNKDLWFYYANPDGTIVKPLMDSPIPAITVDNSVTSMTWSSDDRFIAITLVSPTKSSLYILNVNEPAAQPQEIVMSTSELDSIPSWQPVHVTQVTGSLPELKIDPQSCKPASKLSSALQPPDELYGYDLVQGTSLVDGDFSYEFWLYCDPLLNPNDSEHSSAINGLGIFIFWRYDGPSVDGPVEYYYEFEANEILGKSGSSGPLYKASAAGKLGIILSKEKLKEHIQQGAPLHVTTFINSSLGQNSATFSFHLEPTENGLRVVDLQSQQKNPISEFTPTVVSENLPPIGTGIANGEWIAFLGGQTVPDPANPTAFTRNQNIYLIRPDGSGLTNLTGFQAYDPSSLQWSPNGQHLLFTREDPASNKINILIHDADLAADFGEVTGPIADPDHYGNSWSPNSDKIVFADASRGNYDIYTQYADGRNDPKLTQLTDDPAQDVGFAWSPDGRQIAFQRLDGEKLSVYVMNEDGSNQREVAHGSGIVSLKWSHGGTTIYASSTENNWLECEGCVPKPAIYRIQLDGPFVQQVYYEEDAGKAAGWFVYDTPQNTLYFMRVDHPNFVEFWGTWFRADGDSVNEIGEMDPQQTCKTTTGNILNESISPNPRFSVISNFCGGGFDLYLADRDAPPEKRLIHMLQPPADTEGQGGDSATLPIAWSPDGRWLIYENIGNSTTYLLNIEKALQDPTTQPIVLIQPGYHTDPSGQLFQSAETISLFGLTWQPAP